MCSYWVFRIDTRYIRELNAELSDGRLRQGWGYDEGQNLRNMEVDEGASRNYSMFHKVKKGDIILVPRLPEWNLVSIVEATEDWDKGYDFCIFEKTEDHGHIFPAKPIKAFARNSQNVSGNIRSTLRNPSRFWNIDHYEDDVKDILNSSEKSLYEEQTCIDRLQSVVNDELKPIKDSLYEKINRHYNATEWEYLLVEVLSKLYPSYRIERVGGRKESEHGTDILITIPGISSERNYLIAIQVKDYSGLVGDNVIEQIDRADTYWHEEDGGNKLIDKILIIIGVKKSLNLEFEQKAKAHNIQVLFDSDVKELLFKFLYKCDHVLDNV